MGRRGCGEPPVRLDHIPAAMATATSPPSRTSVRRTALCCAFILPRPAYACGSSRTLWVPSCSASLSDRFMSLPGERNVFGDGREGASGTLVPLGAPPRNVLHQQLADVFQAAHVGELLLQQLLQAFAHAHGHDLHAAARRRRKRREEVGAGTRGAGCAPKSGARHSLMPEIEELRLRVVADEQTPLDAVDVDLRKEERRGKEISVGRDLQPSSSPAA